MIYTTYFDNLKNLPSNVFPIAICGKCPDDYKGLKYPKLAPKKGFWLEWEKNKDNDFYVQHFNDEVLSNLNVEDCIAELYDLLPEDVKQILYITNCPPWENPHYQIALVCFEKPNEFCHRNQVADWINNYMKRKIVTEF